MAFSGKVCILIAASLASLALSGTVRASDEVKFQGSVQLDSDTCSKGAAGAECTVDISITGKAAKVIYDGMPEKGILQECTGNVEKFNDSGMHCIKGKTAADYLCDFGYAFKKHAFTGGPDGC